MSNRKKAEFFLPNLRFPGESFILPKKKDAFRFLFSNMQATEPFVVIISVQRVGRDESSGCCLTNLLDHQSRVWAGCVPSNF